MYQHGSPEVKLLRKLRNENMSVQDHLFVLTLHFCNDVGQPFVLLLIPSHPNKVNLAQKNSKLLITSQITAFVSLVSFSYS